MGRPAVTGAASVEIDLAAGEVKIGERILREGDGSRSMAARGRHARRRAAGAAPRSRSTFQTVLGWADELRVLGVRANADTPDDVRRAIELGAEGVGLCRTEHMFLGERQPLMATPSWPPTSPPGWRRSLLAPLQEADFEEILRAVEGRRSPSGCSDPPLHEFLPQPATLPEGSPERRRVEQLQETNPMLGTRGVRLGILFPELYAMQVHALFAAASRVAGAQIEIMIRSSPTSGSSS